MSLWWRRNGIPVAAIAILLPATIFITFSNEIGAYNKAFATEPVLVETGDTVDYGGADWLVINTERILAGSPEAIESELPAGADLIVVTTLVTPGEVDSDGQSPSCAVHLDELDGDTVLRTFSDSQLDGIEHDRPPTALGSCTKEELDPYRLESIFVVPADANDTLALRLEVYNELPRFLQIRL